MSSAPDHQNPIKNASLALQAIMSVQRFQVVVDRIRKQVKVKGEKRSKWVDTDKFVFRLFEGATITMVNEVGQKLAVKLTNVVADVLCSYRASVRARLTRNAAVQPLTLSCAKQIEEDMHTLQLIDGLGYHVVKCNDTDGFVAIRSPEGVAIVGDDKVMQSLFANANTRLAEIIAPYEAIMVESFQEVVARIP